VIGIDLSTVPPSTLPANYRDAVQDPQRGPLRWTLAESHASPSYVERLWYYTTVATRRALCGQSFETMYPEEDEETRSLFELLGACQPSIMRLITLERELGIRWTRASVVPLILESDLLERAIINAYRSLCYIALERSEVASNWPPCPLWSP
jgi:hypothetical protein